MAFPPMRITILVNLYLRYEPVITYLIEFISILLTTFFYIKYIRNKYKPLYLLYYAYGFLLNSICGFLFIIKLFLKPINNNIDNNIIYFYKVPLIIGIGGFILLIIGANKERRRKGSQR
jgi:hypothetical protein